VSGGTRHDRPLLHGVVAAFALSLAGAGLLFALTEVIDADTALRVVVALLGLGYLLYSITRSPERTGRVTVVVLWLSASVSLWLAAPPAGVYVLLHVGMIWLVRSLYHHSSAVTAVADLGLTLLAAAFATWAANRTGSAWLALWCFFLVQAFFVLLPTPRGARRCAQPAAEDGVAFERAHRAAEAAVRRMAVRH